MRFTHIQGIEKPNCQKHWLNNNGIKIIYQNQWTASWAYAETQHTRSYHLSCAIAKQVASLSQYLPHKMLVNRMTACPGTTPAPLDYSTEATIIRKICTPLEQLGEENTQILKVTSRIIRETCLPEPRGRKSRPTMLSSTEDFPELCRQQ